MYGLDYYTKSALSGGICCSLTHAAVCPVDVVKTRIQLQPEVYNRGLLGGFRQVIAAEGVYSRDGVHQRARERRDSARE